MLQLGKVLGIDDEFGLINDDHRLHPNQYLLNSADMTPVECYPLESLLLAVNRTTIDYFSIRLAEDQLRILDHVPLEKLQTSVRDTAIFEPTLVSSNFQLALTNNN